MVFLKDYLSSQLRPLCIRILSLILIYTIFRILFYLVNADDFPNGDLSLFFYGIRFDLSAIFYTNILYVIAVLVPFSFYYKKIYRKICDIYFILINSLAALVSYIDVAYYPYVLKRMTADIFSYVQIGFDFRTLLPSFLKQFWYLVLLFVATLFIIILVVRFTNRMINNNPIFKTFSWKTFLSEIMILSGFIAISVICMRGGFQLRPLSLIDTGKYASIQNAALVSNTPFTLTHSLGMQHNIEKHYFETLEEAEFYFSPVISHITPCTQNCYPTKNVIIIVLESFSQYLIQGMDLDKKNIHYQKYCPFLDSLLHQSISFNGIANGRRSIEAFPAIFGGIPPLLDMSYVESPFANNYSYSPVEMLKDKGYNTVFYHGAKNGSMNIESYCYSIGFESYYGKNEYPHLSDDDGVWGISDRSYLKYVAQSLNSIRQPFFAGVFTLSSHNPFLLPKDAKGLNIKQGKHPMQTVASYTDYALREFFETISQYSWYDSTLFIITADHTGEGAVPITDNRYMLYQIPIFFYHPLAEVSGTRSIMQHLDIMPSVFSYLNINEPLFSFGNNIFDSTYIPYAINYLSGVYQLFTNDFILQFDGEKTIGFFNIKTDILMQHNLMNNMPKEVALYERKLKAIIQSYTTRMANNQLFIKNK